MRKFKMGLVTLAASAAVLVPATSAPATTSSVASTSAAMTATGGCEFLCFDIYKNDVLSDIDISLVEAELKCTGVNLSLLSIGQQAVCGDNSVKAVRKK
jgi:hypothetical protein